MFMYTYLILIGILFILFILFICYHILLNLYRRVKNTIKKSLQGQ